MAKKEKLKLKSICPLVDGEAYQKIIHWFFCFPNSVMGLGELSCRLEISKTTANRVVNQFVEEGFLKVEVLGRMWRVSCDQTHPYFTSKKIPYNLSLVYGTNIIDAVHEMIPNPRAIVLFGSYRKGDDTESSDIDIAVEVFDNKDVRMILLGIIAQFGYRENVPVNLYVFSRNKVDINIFSNISNGIVIEGFLEVRP